MYKHSKSWVNHSPSTDHLPDPGVEDSIPGSGCTSHPQDTALDFVNPCTLDPWSHPGLMSEPNAGGPSGFLNNYMLGYQSFTVLCS